MTIPTSTLSMLRDALHAKMSGAHVKIREIIDHGPSVALPGRMGSPFSQLVMRNAGTNARRVTIDIAGWGTSLELKTMEWTTAINPDTVPEDAVALAVETLLGRIKRQRETAAQAQAAGVASPLTSDQLQSTGHLSVDIDSVMTLVGFLGSDDAARTWIDEQMRLHREDLLHDGPLGPAQRSTARAVMGLLDPNDDWPERDDLVVRIVGTKMHIPFALKPLRPARGGGDSGSPVWEDDAIYLNDVVPDTLATALSGQTVGELVSGTPIGHRIIHTLIDGGMPGMRSMVVLLEPAHVLLDQVLPGA